jgi:hypothetical protein
MTLAYVVGLTGRRPTSPVCTHRAVVTVSLPARKLPRRLDRSHQEQDCAGCQGTNDDDPPDDVGEQIVT